MTAFLPLPTLNVPLSSRERPIELVELRVSVEISGALAVTTWELVFHNPNARDLEGQLEFPLLDGHTVIRFAMDMHGGLREAVPVPKDKGRQVFEEIVRRGVDPGLLEKTAGNNYKARIYPLPARGRKRVVIAYQEALTEAAYRLPLAFDAPIPSFHLRLAVRGPAAAPVVTRDSLGLSLPAWRQDHVVEVERQGFRAQGLLEIALPPGDRPALTTEERDGKVYFRAEKAIDARTRPRPAPRVIGLLWDASGSAEGRDLGRELAALGAYFAALPGPLEVRLIRLRDAAEAAEVHKVEKGEWSALRRAIERTFPDGASSLAGVAADPAVDAWILVSDGLLNFGPLGDEAEGALVGGRAPLHVLCAAARADHGRLRDLADRSGGAHVDLLNLSPETAVLELTHERERLLEIDSSPREVSHLYPEAPTALPYGGLVLAGVLRAQTATLRVRVGFADDPGSSRTIDLEIRADEERGSLAARAWAAAKIAALEPRYAKNRADIDRTGQDFGIVTRQTSLIILDEVADYVRYDITPPPELREACDRLRRSAWQTRQRGEQERLANLTRLFQSYCAWYDTTYDRDPPKPALPNERSTRTGGVVAFGGVASPDVALAIDDDGAAEFEAADEPAPVARRMSRAAPAPRAAARPPTGAPPPPMAAAPPAAPAPAPTMDAMPMEEAREAAAPGGAGKGGSEGGGGGAATIQLQKWTPDAPYLDRLRRTPDERLYHVYCEERLDYARSTAFFLDVADVFFDRKMPELALRILSNLAEMELENPAILRILGYRLLQARRADLARPVFEEVLRMRPEEPQSHRDLAHACAALGDLQPAIDHLWAVASGAWDRRFPEIELLALVELNAIIAAASSPLDTSKIPGTLRRAMPLDLRVVLTWDADNTDIDLWVTDPNGEKAYYAHRLTRQGGRMSPDFREGYGPEEFSLRRAMPGEYLVEANFYGNTQQIIAGATTIQLQFITGFATPDARDQRVTMRLRDTREVVTVGRFTVGR